MRKDKSLLLGCVCAMLALLQTPSTTANHIAGKTDGTVVQKVIAGVIEPSGTFLSDAKKPLADLSVPETATKLGVAANPSL